MGIVYYIVTQAFSCQKKSRAEYIFFERESHQYSDSTRGQTQTPQKHITTRIHTISQSQRNKQPAKKLNSKTVPNTLPNPQNYQETVQQPRSHHETSQSMRPAKFERPSFMHNLVSHQRKYATELSNLWMGSTSSSKAILFLAFQTFQKRHKGSTLHISYLCLPIRGPFHPFNACLIEEGKQATSKKEEILHYHPHLNVMEQNMI